MKRFTETTKWRDPWFRRLSPNAKHLWNYLTDNCDCTGLIDLDLEAASFDIGANIQEKHLAELGNRLQRTETGKIFIPGFIPFHYGKLSEGCPAHKHVIKLVTERKLSMNGKGYQYPNARVGVEYPYSTIVRKEEEVRKEEGECEGKQAPSLVPTDLDIYQAYPRHEAKPEALRAIGKALKIVGPTYLLERTVAYSRTQPPRSQFTPLPATWFNAERYNDDPAEWTRGATNNQKPPTEREMRLDRERKEAEERVARRKAGL